MIGLSDLRLSTSKGSWRGVTTLPGARGQAFYHPTMKLKEIAFVKGIVEDRLFYEAQGTLDIVDLLRA